MPAYRVERLTRSWAREVTEKVHRQIAGDASVIHLFPPWTAHRNTFPSSPPLNATEEVAESCASSSMSVTARGPTGLVMASWKSVPALPRTPRRHSCRPGRRSGSAPPGHPHDLSGGWHEDLLPVASTTLAAATAARRAREVSTVRWDAAGNEDARTCSASAGHPRCPSSRRRRRRTD